MGPGDGPGSEHVPGLRHSDSKYAESVGQIASPLLAGFSFTAVIMVSEDPEKFYLADAAIPFLALATVALIAAVQCSKYVPERGRPNRSRSRWYGGTLISYHGGLFALLLGLSCALAPPPADGAKDWARWVACGIAFGAALGQFGAFCRGDRSWWSAIRNLCRA